MTDKLMQGFLVVMGWVTAGIWVKSVIEVTKRNRAFVTTPWLSWLGIFVWGDAIIISLFWVGLAVLGLWAGSKWWWLGVAIFWAVRGVGETVYWLNQQFSTIKRNPPETMWGYQWIRSEAIWFVYQIFWQMVTVVAIMAGILIGRES